MNDGSRDQSLSILKEFAASDEKVKIVNFSRNFGHEAAMIAGLDYAGGDGIVCMDVGSAASAGVPAGESWKN